MMGPPIQPGTIKRGDVLGEYNRNLHPEQFANVTELPQGQAAFRRLAKRRGNPVECEHPEEEVDFHDDGGMTCGVCGDHVEGEDEVLELPVKPKPTRHLRPV